MASLWHKVKAWAQRRIIEPFIEYLKQDTEPKVLARSATLGFALGLCPIIGVSALLCIAICFFFTAAIFAPMALLMNFVAVPFEVLLIIPFMRFGELILQADKIDVIPEHFSDIFKGGEILKGLAHAVFGWMLICAVLFWPVSALLTPCFAALKRRFSTLRRTESEALLDDDAAPEADLELGQSIQSSPRISSLRQERPSTLSPRSSRDSMTNEFSTHV